MNYFELFEIPVQLKVDAASLKKKFFELSRKFHPDYVATGSEQLKTEALEFSSLLNQAWNTFQNPDETIRYVLKSKNLVADEEKYGLPKDFLMEVLEINERLMEETEFGAAMSDPEAGAEGSLLAAVNNLQNEIYGPVQEIVENYKEGITSEKELLQVKEYYFKKKYLDRIRRQLVGKA